jgi:antitoxin ParD1/3/4
MTSLNISLPDPLKAYVEDRVSSGDFGTPSEFVRNLIRQDKEQRRASLEMELIAALQGEALAISPDELKGRTLVSVLREKLAGEIPADNRNSPR